jgi:hypothetical protein
MECYQQDDVEYLNGRFETADKYKIAWLSLSSPTGHWEGLHTTCSTLAAPMASCSNNADLEYANTVIVHIIGNSAALDRSSVYTTGFSQNGMFSGFVGVCLGSSRIAGSFIGGAGLYVKSGKAPAPSFRDGAGTQCAYFPAYPCHVRHKKLKIWEQETETLGMYETQDPRRHQKQLKVCANPGD